MKKDFSYCYRCKLENDITAKQCGNCGGRVITSKRVRVLGGLLIGLGLFLTLMMGGLMLLFAGMITHTGPMANQGNFNGTREQVAAVFGLLGVIFAIGVTSLIGGIYQIKHGKRNLKIQIATFILVALVILSYWLLQAMFPSIQTRGSLYLPHTIINEQI